MKPLNGYDKAQAYSDTEKLPVGGYVLKILNVDFQEYDWGNIILLSFDIAEGDYKGFFQNSYKSSTREDKKWKGTYRLRVPLDDGSEKDNWTMRRFKTDITAFEESNSGYHWNWNEQSLKNKYVGGVFNNKEYEIEGRSGFFTNCHNLTTVEKIRSGNFKIPQDTLLKSKSSAPATSSNDDWMNVPFNVNDGEVPFN